MLTYPKSTMRVRRISMHLSSGHVTLMPGNFTPPPNFPQSDLGRRADSRWALPHISSISLCEIFWIKNIISKYFGLFLVVFDLRQYVDFFYVLQYNYTSISVSFTLFTFKTFKFFWFMC